MAAEANRYDVTKTATKYIGVPPHLRALSPDVLYDHLPEAAIAGIPAQSGVTMYNGRGELVATARDASWVLRAIHPNGEIEVGGTPHEDHLEHLRGREVGVAMAGKISRTLREALRAGESIPYGAMRYGTERESWAQDPLTGALMPVPRGVQIELQQTCFESPREPQETPQGVIYDRAHAVLEAEKELSGLSILDTSVPLVGSLDDPGVAINDGPDYGPYVQMTNQKLQGYMDHPTSYATDLIQRVTGETFGHIQKRLGHTGYWLNAASHVATSYPQVNTATEIGVVPLEIAIADADMKVSNFSSLLEMLMASSPLFLGQKAEAMGEDGNVHWLLDTRAILRHLMDTAGPPDKFVRTPEEYRTRVAFAIENALTATGDRGAYLTTYPDGTIRSMMHGAVRMRMAAKQQGMKGGRTEYTGCGASPSLVDEAGRNALLELMTVGAYEAVEAHQHPAEYFAAKGFPSFADVSQQQELMRLYSMYGPEHPAVQQMIHEGVRFIDYIASQYPASLRIQQAGVLARERIANLLTAREATPRSLAEYRHNPRGSISVVMQHMVEDGYTPLAVMKALVQYQHDTANDVIGVKGDVVQLLNTRR